MSADDPIKTLRAAGHDESADLLEQVKLNADRAEAARKGPGVTREQMERPSIPVMSTAAFAEEQARQREGEAVFERLRASGVLDRHVSGGSILGDGDGR